MDILQKVSGTLRALGYTEKELQENLQIGKQRAKTLLTGQGNEISLQEYCAICNMLGIDANFFYRKGKQVS